MIKQIQMHPWILIISLVLIFGAGTLYLNYFHKPRFEFVKPKQGPIVEAVYGIGTVVSKKQFHGRIAQATGIKEIFVNEGDIVKRGDRLISLQDGEGFHAPFNGTVTSLPFFEKETVLGGTIVITLQDLNDLHLLATLEQHGALRVRPGQKVRVNFESLRHETFSGYVRAVYPQDNQFLVDVVISKFPNSILPSMTADVAIEIARRESAILIPLRAISGGKVITYREGKQMKTDLKIGATDSEWAEVLKGDIGLNDQLILPKN